MSKELETFEKNGGYFIDGVPIWIVKSQVKLYQMSRQISSLLLVEMH